MAEMIVVALVFVAVVVGATLWAGRQTSFLDRGGKNVYVLFFLLLAAGVVLRLILAYQTPGYSADMSCFRAWSYRAYSGGLGAFYDPTGAYFCDYPPGYLYILYGIGFLQNLFQLDWYGAGMTLLIKLPSILFDVLTALFLFWVCVRRGYFRTALLAALFVALNPALIFDGAVWGQVDSVFAFFLVVFVYALVQKRYLVSTVFYAFALLIKPQALLFAPIIFFALLFEKDPLSLPGFRADLKSAWAVRFYNLAACILLGMVVFLIFCLPFSNVSPLYILQEKYFGTMGSYDYATVNAFNFYALLGLNYTPTTPVTALSNWIFMALGFAAVIVLFWRAKRADKAAFIATFSTLFFFLFLTKMHERYLYSAILLCFLYAALSQDRRMFLACGVLSVCQFLNITRVYEGLETIVAAPYDGYPVVTALLLIAVAAYLAVYGYRYLIQNRPLSERALVLKAAQAKKERR